MLSSNGLRLVALDLNLVLARLRLQEAVEAVSVASNRHHRLMRALRTRFREVRQRLGIPWEVLEWNYLPS